MGGSSWCSAQIAAGLSRRGRRAKHDRALAWRLRRGKRKEVLAKLPFVLGEGVPPALVQDG